MQLIIIRGPSGSGKSTLARCLGGVQQSNWFEADMYFLKDGVYTFNPSELGKAHNWCRDGVELAISHHLNASLGGLKPGYNQVIISNTSMTKKEVDTYLQLAANYDVPAEVIRTPRPWNIDDLFARNEHNVPREVLERQIARYVAVDGEREWNDLSIFTGA